MFYILITAILISISIALFVNIQFYLNHPRRKEWRDEWFARFEEANRQRFTDPELAWRYEVFEKAFHKAHPSR